MHSITSRDLVSQAVTDLPPRLGPKLQAIHDPPASTQPDPTAGRAGVLVDTGTASQPGGQNRAGGKLPSPLEPYGRRQSVTSAYREVCLLPSCPPSGRGGTNPIPTGVGRFRPGVVGSANLWRRKQSRGKVILLGDDGQVPVRSVHRGNEGGMYLRAKGVSIL